MRIRNIVTSTAAAAALVAGMAACGGSQPASSTPLPSVATQASPTANALTVDKAGGTSSQSGDMEYGALVTNHDQKNIAMTVRTTITFFDAKGVALGNTTDMSAGPIMPGHTVAIGGGVGQVIPAGTTAVKATGKATATTWQVMPRYLSQGKVAVSDLQVDFTQGKDMDGRPAAQYNETKVRVTATSSFGNTWKSNASAVCMDAAGNIISGAPAHPAELEPNTPTILQVTGITGPQPASCVMSVEPKLTA